MKLLQVTNLCLLLSSLHSSEGNDNQNKIMSTLRSSQTAGTETSTPIQVTMSPPNITTLIAGTSPKVGTTDKGSLQTNQPTLPITVKAEGATTIDTMKKNLTNISTTVSPLPRTISTSQSSQKSSKSPSSISTTQITVSTSEPGASISKTISTIPGSTSPSGGTENAKMPSPSSSTNPSHSNIILPVVIALIVITLSVFALVGLYRICRKTDPGTPENGNDQPQSDKESVKLLTVKTISHESGEHSAQGKIKN